MSKRTIDAFIEDNQYLEFVVKKLEELRTIDE